MAVLYRHHPRFLHVFYSIPFGDAFPLLDASVDLSRFADTCVEMLDALVVLPLPDTVRYNNNGLASNVGKRRNECYTIGT